MVDVNIKYKGMKNIKSIIVKGHAGYDVYGKDIVCAGISAIMYGGINALCSYIENAEDIELIDKYEKENTLGFNMLNDVYMEPEIQAILKTIMIQLKTIYEDYKNYISFDVEYCF